MSRTTLRVLRTELLRGTAPVAAVAVAVAAGVLLFIEPSSWAGRWGPLAEQMRFMILLLGPLATAAGAWQAGREGRRRTRGLVSTTPRPRSERMVLVWAAVTLGTFVGYLAAWLAGAVAVAPVVSYSGRGWWWTLAGGLAGLAAMSALGVMVGRLIPHRLTAPLVGGAVSVAMISARESWHGRGGATWLLPFSESSTNGTSYLEAGFQLFQVLWFAAVTATLLILTSTRRAWLAVAPAAVAVAVALPIATGPGEGRWQDDPAAQELVCAEGQDSNICLPRVNAFLLDDTVRLLHTHLDRWASISSEFHPPAADPSSAARAETITEYVASLPEFVTWDGSLDVVNGGGRGFTDRIASAATGLNCERSSDVDDTALRAEYVASGWVGRTLAGGSREDYYGEGAAHIRQDADALAELPEAERNAWMGRYLAAARECDQPALKVLAEELELR